MTTKLSGYYQQAYASHSKHFNQCFYCGCEATERDYCPPLHMMQSIIDLGEDAEFISIPACYECFALLHNERVLTIDGRFTKVKKKIANKYAKALRVFHMWHENELDDMSDEFVHSIKAGMKLGEEAAQRLDFQGYSYATEDARVTIREKRTEFDVQGIVFYDFKEALNYCINELSVDKSDFYKLVVEDYNGDFNRALSQYRHRHEKVTAATDANTLIKSFAKQHKQNSDFVTRTVTHFINKDPSLTTEGALEKLYTNYIKK
ncbi:MULTISPECIES: hypothetical protein [Pseudoalteromonas]|uniref:Orphan protein n=1 Tax=Pseudoalteromonas lipolytica TaxID=570156 RepID=A0ABY1GSR3_9GAMM|nr:MULTISPECIES: hypothetical protein [Pseudoalteromonas]MBE0350785.1 hypothetical protein [Pseudoalteromonas lipolytica LMEB 39]MCC9662159.1 hypothetical protein [Pseudoalteromonas sp. MB41]QLJ06942.1 hypothetical protein GZH31_08855 [Pseudoalteromonas sp. JSTW]SFT85099.1 hypothetical protein SAMN04487854_1124 [Pseudoalteromonas lipolytica]